MCGICGIYNTDNKTVDKDILWKMTRILKHRGNDARGIKTACNVGLGHQRLSIIALNSSADQPFVSCDNRFWIVYNGEIYNFHSVKKELEAFYPFRTHSDTEVIVCAWARWGEKCLEKLNGMFAFVIWDSREKKLFCVRDRIGVKPFFYFHINNIFAFASEIKSLLLHPVCNKEIDYTSLSDYLSLGYIPCEKTIYSHIRKLLPGTIMTVDKYGAVNTKKYWDIKPFFEKTQTNNIYENMRTLIDNAVRERLVSDVEIGFFLSGGIDSSAVLKYASRYCKNPKTFTLGFKEFSYDERGLAEKYANEMGTDHYSTVFNPPDMTFLNKLMWYHDQPFADTSSVPTFQLCKYASQKVKVVLSGDGGDEMFGGYETYRADILASFIHKIPFSQMLIKLISGTLSLIPADYKKVSARYKLKQFFKYSDLPLPGAHLSWRLLFDEEAKRKLLDGKINEYLSGYRTLSNIEKYYDDLNGLDIYKQHMYVDLSTWLVDDILVKLDTASMTHSLEVRSPFLDRNIVEFASGLKNTEKTDIFNTKKILKRALSQDVPYYIIKKRKQGFNSPVSLWLVSHFKKEFIDTIESEVFKTFFPNTGYIKSIYEQHENKVRDLGMCLWTLFMFGLWTRNYLETDSKVAEEI